MTITYTWKITGLKTKDFDIKPSSIVQTYWQKIGTDEAGNTGTFSGATPFTVDPTDEAGPFIPFEQLTEADVISWIQTIVVGDYEKHVNAQIAKEIEGKVRPVKDVALPWDPTSTVPGTPDAPAANKTQE